MLLEIQKKKREIKIMNSSMEQKVDNLCGVKDE